MSESAYRKIAESIDAGAMTAPKANGDFSPTFIQFLKLLYTPDDTEIVQHLKMPVAIFPSMADLTESMLSADDIACAAGKSPTEVADVLDALARQGRVIGIVGRY